MRSTHRDDDATGCTGRYSGLYHRSTMIEPRRQEPPETLLDLLDAAFARYADRPAVRMWQEDGTRETWTYAELDRRSRIAASRLRHQLGLQKGDRLLTWSPSGPGLAA